MSANLITVSELLEAPTGVDWSTMAENATATSLAQTVEQLRLIERASAWAANFCGQRLDATTDTESATLGSHRTKAWVSREGWLIFHCDYFPVVGVLSASWATITAGVGVPTQVALDVSKIQIRGDYPRLNWLRDLSMDWSGLQYYPTEITVNYINGWPNTYLTASASAGANVVLSVESTLGMTTSPGSVGNRLTIYDGSLTETVQVSAVLSATTVQVASLTYTHTLPSAGPGNTIGVSSVPQDIKEAVILACVHMAQERGSDALVMGSARTSTPGSRLRLPEAEYLLLPYRRVL